MVILRHLGFLKIYFFEQLVSSGELICVIVQNFSKIGQTVLEISQFFGFSRWPPSTILDFEIFKFLVNRQIGGLMCITMPNFTTIGQTHAEISHFTIFKIVAIRHLGFLKV